MINCPACSSMDTSPHFASQKLQYTKVTTFDSGKPSLSRRTYAHLQDVTAEGPCFCIVPCRSAPFSFWSRCRTLPSPRGGLVAFAICLCLRAGPPPFRGEKKLPGPGFEYRPKNYPPPQKKNIQPRTGPLHCKKKEKKGIVVESTLAFVPAFVPFCIVLMTKTRFLACGIRSLLTRELVYGSMQCITTLLA